jgi:hypothetical protein
VSLVQALERVVDGGGAAEQCGAHGFVPLDAVTNVTLRFPRDRRSETVSRPSL